MDLPSNLIESCSRFKTSVNKLKAVCANFVNSFDEIKAKSTGNSTEEAQLDLLLVFTLNSLFWVYLSCKGIDPKTNKLRAEIDRIRNIIVRLNQLKDKNKAPKVDVKAAQRFVSHALFTPGSNQTVVKTETSMPQNSFVKKETETNEANPNINHLRNDTYPQRGAYIPHRRGNYARRGKRSYDRGQQPFNKRRRT